MKRIIPTQALERFVSCLRQIKVGRCSNSRSSWPCSSCCIGTGRWKRCVSVSAHAKKLWPTTHTGRWTTTCALRWHSTGLPENRFVFVILPTCWCLPTSNCFVFNTNSCFVLFFLFVSIIGNTWYRQQGIEHGGTRAGSRSSGRSRTSFPKGETRNPHARLLTSGPRRRTVQLKQQQQQLLPFTTF